MNGRPSPAADSGEPWLLDQPWQRLGTGAIPAARLDRTRYQDVAENLRAREVRIAGTSGS